MPGSDDLNCIYKIFNGDTLVFHKKGYLFGFLNKLCSNSNKTYISLKIRDVLTTIYFFFFIKKNYKNLKFKHCVGVESINTLLLISFKKIMNFKYIYYYVFDWSPYRFSNKVLNHIYIKLDKFSSYKSSACWNITYTIENARKNILNYDQYKISKQYYVPYSPYVKSQYILNQNRDNYKIIYSGGLIEENGAHLLVPLFQKIYQKNKRFTLDIIGDGECYKSIEKKIKELNLETQVKLLGYIENEDTILNLQSKATFGLAPYPHQKNSRKYYGDVIKIRLYFASGLIVQSSNVPPVHKEISNLKLGNVSFSNNLDEYAFNILDYNENKINDYRKNIEKHAKKFTWQKTYNDSLLK